MSPVFRGDLPMMVTTTSRDKNQDSKLKSYVNKIVKNINFYTGLINCIEVTFEADSAGKENTKYGCHLSLHLLDKKTIDIKVICKYTKNAFDQVFNQLSNELRHSVRAIKGTIYS
jgi:ribosome-associated translation inhibitor RaiA